MPADGHVPMWIYPGDYILTDRDSQADQWRHVLAEINHGRGDDDAC